MSKHPDLAEAQYQAEIAWDEYQELVDDYYDRHYGDPEVWEKVVAAMKKATAADCEVTKQAMRHGYRAQDAHLEEAYETTEF